MQYNIQQYNEIQYIRRQCYLTIFGPGGGYLFAYICANTRTSSLKKTWLFSVMSLEKGSTLFTP